ncbi:hypothetical protein JNM05_13525 [bacterium]|nr:hypothetical protein [bacterium]
MNYDDLNELLRKSSEYRSLTRDLSLELTKLANAALDIQKATMGFRDIGAEFANLVSARSTLDSLFRDQFSSINLSILGAYKSLSPLDNMNSIQFNENTLRTRMSDLEVASVFSTTSQLSLSSRLTAISEFSLLAENRFLGINRDVLGYGLKIDVDSVSDTFNKTLEFSKSYDNLFKSVDTTRFFKHPAVITDFPPRETYAHARVLGLISSNKYDEPEEEIKLNTTLHKENSDVEKLISDIDPKLLTLLHGAKEASKSTNSDKARHCTTSLRELFTHIIHNLAPDNEIKKWSTDTTHYSKDKPTRRARLYYICRNINTEAFSEFVDKDVDALLSCVDMYQAGTHRIENPFSDQQLDAIILRTELGIRFLLEVNRTR